MKFSMRYFHGTTLSNARDIETNGIDPARIGTGLWLGWGFYFFENGFEHAKSWAQKDVEKSGGVAAVIEAELDLRNVLDLSDRNHWPGIGQTYEKLKNEVRVGTQTGMTILHASDEQFQSESWKHPVDHLVLDEYSDALMLELQPSGEKLGAIRCPFTSGRIVYEGSWFGRRSCVMLCLKDFGLMSGFEIHSGF